MWGRVHVHLWVWWGSLRERDYLEDENIDGRMKN
jgi:hypothetical protein